MRIKGYRQTGRPTQLKTISHLWAFKPDYLPGGVEEPYGGKWLIFVPPAKVDALWRVIKVAVESSQLSTCAKVSSTGMALKSYTKEHLICVYTSDFRDKDEVLRVRETLRNIGITWQISYKSSEEYRLMEQGYSPDEIAELHPKGYYIKYRV